MENPKKYEVVVTPFSVKENIKDMEVPPKAKDYKMKVATEAEKEFTIELQDGEFQIEDNIVSFMEGSLKKSGKLVSNADFEARRTAKKEQQKVSGMDR